MNYAAIRSFDVTNGEGTGVSLFVSGCPFHCEGCFNPETWDYDYGKPWTPEVEDKFVELAGRDYIKRISLLGGSPLCDKNIKDVGLLVQRLKSEYPDKQIWVYTGYIWERIIAPVVLNKEPSIAQEYRKEALNFIDVLVDGQFIYDEKDLSLAFRGSKNQRIIDVKSSLLANKVVLRSNDND